MNPNQVYFPDGPPLQRETSHIPVTQPDAMHGPGNIQLFQSPPDPERQSEEQGIGRSPGQRWPHLPHVEQYNFDSLSNMAWHPGEVVVASRQGWSAPTFYEQSPMQHQDLGVPIVINEAATAPYTLLNGVGP